MRIKWISPKCTPLFSQVYFTLLLSMIQGVFGKRHKPGFDEIERVINDTHSVIWGCPICYSGQGLSVKCGTSVPFNRSIECLLCEEGVTYSDTEGTGVCLPCRVCSENQLKTGVCSLEVDSIDCAGCIEGYYKEITGDCHECSWCCVNDSRDEYMPDCVGLLKNKRCRKQKHSDECVPQETTVSTLAIVGTKLTPAEIAGIAIGVLVIIIAIIIAVLCVLWRKDLRREVQNFLRRICCYQTIATSSDEDSNDQEPDCEMGTCEVKVISTYGQNPHSSRQLLSGDACDAIAQQLEVSEDAPIIGNDTKLKPGHEGELGILPYVLETGDQWSNDKTILYLYYTYNR